MPNKKQLFGGDESEEEEEQVNINTNTEYAKKYDDWRKKELLHKFKAKYGEDPLLDDSNSSSSSSEDDEESVFMNEKFNKGFYKVMAALKSKDPKIYDKEVKFFEEESDNEENTQKKIKKTKKELPFDSYTGEVMLNQDLESNSDHKAEPKKSTIKDDLKLLEEDSDDSEDDTFKSNVKKKKPEQNDEIQEKKILENVYKKKAKSKEEKFLYNYIIAEGPKDNIVFEDGDEYTKNIEDHSDDDEQDAKQEEYEHKYNFRFEEPDPDFIKRFPRVIESSMRIKDDKRKQKRAEVKERKMKEKQEKMQEIRQLQELKLKEIEEKISKLKQVTGQTEIQFSEKDLEGEFDPEEHDRRMQALFNDEFYQGPEEEYKPEFPDLDEELEIENWNKFRGSEDLGDEGNENGEDGGPHCEDDNFNMDCDYDPSNVQKELIESTRGKKKRKRKSKFAQVLSQPRPVFDPKDKTYEQYLDEYYKLDCEDIIGDLPCRFKYRQVVPNSFGLSIEEILSANDKELNRWCSIKKTMGHRPDNVEKYDVIAYERKAHNIDLKKKILPSLFEEQENKNKKKKADQSNSTITSETPENSTNYSGVHPEKKKKNKKSKKLEANSTTTQNEDSPSLNESVETTDEGKREETEESSENHINADVVKKKKKKKKQKSSPNEEICDVPEAKEIEDEPKDQPEKKMKNKKKKRNPDANIQSKESVDKKRKHKFEGNGLNPKKKQKKNKDEQPMGISDERLKAYGLNPKKFKNKLKYKN